MSTLIRHILGSNLEFKIDGENNENGGSKIKASAIFQKADEPNANGQLFKYNVLKKAVDKIQPLIKKRRFLGELDHPDDIEDINRISQIMLKSASHVITSLEMDGKFVVGTFETLSSPNGIILSSLLKDNIGLGVSIRALTQEDVNYDEDSISDISSFKLVSYDVVHDPAYEEAMVNGILSSTRFYNLSNKNKINNDNLSFTQEEFKSFLENYTKKMIMKIKKNI